MEKASFDASSEQFNVVAKAGAPVSRALIEAAIVTQAKAMERDYRVVWDAGDKTADAFAKRGQPFAAPLLAGGTFDFATVFEQQPVVLTFWASWCGPCLVEAPHLAALHRRYAERGVAFLAISIDEPDDYGALRKVVADLALPYPVLLDPKGEILGKYAQGASIPLSFVIGENGDVLYRHQNFTSGDEVKLDEAIARALSKQDEVAP